MTPCTPFGCVQKIDDRCDDRRYWSSMISKTCRSQIITIGTKQAKGERQYIPVRRKCSRLGWCSSVNSAVSI